MQMCRILTHICISEGQGKLLGKRPWLSGSALLASLLVKGSLSALFLAKELSWGLGWSGLGFVLLREGCNMVQFWG